MLFVCPQVCFFYHFVTFQLRKASTISNFSLFKLEMHEPNLTSLFAIAKHVTFTFQTVVWPSIHQSDIFSYFETSKHVTRYPFFYFLSSKYVISAFPLSTSFRHPSSSSLTSKSIICALCLSFWQLSIFLKTYFDVCKRSIHTLYLACFLTKFKNPIVTFPKAL